MGRRATVLVAAMVVAVVAMGGAAFAAVVSNGGFEAGNLDGWTVANQDKVDAPSDGGNWFAYEGTASPLNGAPIAAPPRGTFAATTDQDGPGSHVLYKNVNLRGGMKHRLSFFLYYENDAGAFYPRNTLDPNFEPNQQYRVDVLRPNADPFTTAPDAILATVFRTRAGDPNKLAPTRRVFNLTPFAGKTVRLRFAEVDNEGPFSASVDEVKVTSTRR